MPALRNLTNGATIASDVTRAEGWWQKTVGLLGRRVIAPSQGIWLDRCGAIHTLGMSCAIDVLFVDHDGCVLEIRYGVRPFLFVVTCPNAAGVIELGETQERPRPVSPGDCVILTDAEDSTTSSGV